MPLLDIDWAKDGRDPLAFLAHWAASVADALNKQFPEAHPRFVAQLRTETRAGTAAVIVRFGRGPVTFDPGAPTHVAPARFTDQVWVSVGDGIGPDPLAAVLFVTRDNKADSDASLAFAVRAAGLMSTGAGVVIVDALPGPASWATHLHSLTGVYPITRRPRGTDSPILAVHPSVQDGAERFAVWHHTVAAGFPLPTVPVAVRGAKHLTLDLEATYAEACANDRVS